MYPSKTIASCIEQIFPENQRWKCTLLQSWNTAFAQLRSKAYIEKIYDDTIVIAVFDACWLQELYMLSETLRAQINATLDKPYVKQIRFKRAGKLSQPKRTPQYSTSPRMPKKNVTLTPQERHALVQLHDPQLAAALEKFLVRCYQERS